MKKEIKTKISNSIVQTTTRGKSLILQYDNITILQVIHILLAYTSNLGIFMGTLDSIIEELSLPINKKTRAKVKDILNILKEEGLVEIKTEVKSGISLRINISNLQDVERNYFIISNSEFKIFNSIEDSKIRNNAFAVYCDLVSRAGDKVYCYPSYETIMNDTGVRSKPTITNTLKLLQEKELIMYGNKGYFSNNSGAKKSNNIYVIVSKFKDYFEAEDYFYKLVPKDKEDKNDKIINLKDKKTDNLVKEDKNTIDKSAIHNTTENNPFNRNYEVENNTPIGEPKENKTNLKLINLEELISPDEGKILPDGMTKEDYDFLIENGFTEQEIISGIY